MKARRIVLRARADGPLTVDAFDSAAVQLPPLEPEQARVRVVLLSIDPYLRTLLGSRPAFGRSLPAGATVPGRGLAEVIDSATDRLRPGDLVVGELGWQDFANVAAAGVRTVARGAHPLSWHLGVLGVPGITALLALDAIGGTGPDQVVFVSSAAGAVGSAAGQIAKATGSVTIGSASASKVAVCRDAFRYDLCIDRVRLPEIATELAGRGLQLDVLFDSVGDELLAAVASSLRAGARVLLCGRLSDYDAPPNGQTPAVRLSELILTQRLRVQGFNVRDHLAGFDAAIARLTAMADDGRLRQVDTVIPGLDRAPQALVALLHGAYAGKVLVAP
jgi:NADPH-dependent curcumin reductase CurA